MLTAINHVNVKACVFLLKFVVIGFVSSIISSDVINESSIILAKYLPLSKLRVAGFQI